MRSVHCFPPSARWRQVLEMTMTSTLDSETATGHVRSRAQRPIWSDDDVPADHVPERYRLGEAFVPKGRYLDAEFQQLEVDRLFTQDVADGVSPRGPARRRQLLRVPDRRPLDPRRPRVDRHHPRLLQRLPPPRHPPRHRTRPRRRADLPVPRLALEPRRLDPPRARPRGVRAPLRRRPRPAAGAGRHVGRLRVHQHGPRGRAAARVPRPDPRGVRAVPPREHALPVDEERHRAVQLEDRARRVPRGVPRARHPPAAHPLGQAQPQHRHAEGARPAGLVADGHVRQVRPLRQPRPEEERRVGTRIGQGPDHRGRPRGARQGPVEQAHRRGEGRAPLDRRRRAVHRQRHAGARDRAQHPRLPSSCARPTFPRASRPASTTSSCSATRRRPTGSTGR